ncbi:MAG: DUF2777 family protein [Bacilli bacterium]
MNLYRSTLLQEQARNRSYGTIDCIGGEWVFFENTSDEAFMLESLIASSPEVYKHGHWLPIQQLEHSFFRSSAVDYMLMEGDELRIERPMLPNVERLLRQLSDETFYSFLQFINTYGFSIYDCIYCHHYGAFMSSGVNFLILDNTETIASVHHSFSPGDTGLDHTFELFASDGMRRSVDYTEQQIG